MIRHIKTRIVIGILRFNHQTGVTFERLSFLSISNKYKKPTARIKPVRNLKLIAVKDKITGMMLSHKYKDLVFSFIHEKKQQPLIKQRIKAQY